jgi:type I restriction enzyme, S subunit
MSGWPLKKLRELTTISRGSSPRPIADERYFAGGTIPWIKIADATRSGKFLYETKEHVNEFGASFSRRLPPGTILVAASGTLGYTQILGVEGCTHDGWLILQDLRGVDRDFLYYALKTMERHFYNSAYGAAIQNINTDILRETEILCPPLEVQSHVAGALSAYDDLIENNARRILILEETARRIFKQEFDAGPHTKSLSKGKTLKRLRDLADDIRSPADPRSIASETPYVGLEHIPRRSTTMLDWGRAGEVGSLKLRFLRGDILFGKIRPYFHKTAVVPMDGVASSDAIVIRPRDVAFRAIVALLVSSDAFIAHAVQTSNGTKMPRADWKVLREYPIALPSRDQIVSFDKSVWPMIDLAANLAAQNRNLGIQRDLLLPKLISGEIDVSRAGRIMEAAE